MKRINDLTGMTFGRWTVNGATKKRTCAGEVIWHCLCSCGTVKDIPGGNLKSGQSKSCGCLHKDVMAQKRKPRKRGMQVMQLREADGWSDVKEFLSS